MFPMLKQKQRWLHMEEGHCGDCYRTCIAVCLGMVRDSVPHFVELYGGDGWNDGEAVSQEINAWLNDRGMMKLEVPMSGEVPFDRVVEIASSWLGGLSRFIIGGKSVRGFDHVIVWDKDEGYWDPAKNAVNGEEMLVGPQTGGVWWIIAIVPTWDKNSKLTAKSDEQLFLEGVLR